MKLYAWIGEDEFGSGVVGLKHALVPAGDVPLVCIESDRHKLETPGIRSQLQHIVNHYGKTMRLAAFELTEDGLITLEPQK